MRLKQIFSMQQFAGAALFAATCVLSSNVLAADSVASYPEKVIRVISPFAAGGTTDILARMIGADFFPASGQPMIVENVTGAGGTIGAGHVARAAPDGYTLEVGGVSTHAMSGSLYKKLPFDPVESFEPVSMLAHVTTGIAVNANSPFQTFEELVEYAKQNPGKLAYSSGGIGSINHLTMASLTDAADLDMLHVPYRGGGPAALALIQDEVQVFAGGTSLILPHVKSGAMRLLAVTGPERSRILPDVPAVNETVPGFQTVNWYGVLAPAGLNPELKEKIWTELDRIMRKPEVVEQMTSMGLEYPGLTTEQFKTALHNDQKQWSAIIEKLDIASD